MCGYVCADCVDAGRRKGRRADWHVLVVVLLVLLPQVTAGHSYSTQVQAAAEGQPASHRPRFGAGTYGGRKTLRGPARGSGGAAPALGHGSQRDTREPARAKILYKYTRSSTQHAEPRAATRARKKEKSKAQWSPWYDPGLDRKIVNSPAIILLIITLKLQRGHWASSQAQVQARASKYQQPAASITTSKVREQRTPGTRREKKKKKQR
ncbi:hypothetical protein F5884DRAFT_438290 [Xylogone sp. PMI_703]|nr:hypothetical protein F5884DRAFT_438290 [Xylogone sp. PMI_703]